MQNLILFWTLAGVDKTSSRPPPTRGRSFIPSFCTQGDPRDVDGG
jgi:hypothetical protein